MMERADRRPILSTQSNKIEPTFVPQWLKSPSNVSSQSDDRVKSRPSMSGSDLDAIERNSSSLRRTLSINGSSNSERDRQAQLRPYRSFGKNNRDRDSEFVEKRKPGTSENGNGLSFSRPSMRSTISKASFEREFPSLKSEDRQGSHEISRVSSPGLSSAVQNLPLGSALIGDGWTSALAEVPSIVGQVGSTSSSSSTGLNMAEALAQAPPKARSSPKQLSIDNQRLEEFALRQSRQLVPVTPSTSRASAFSPSEKLKPKVSRGVTDYGAPIKTPGQPPMTHLVGHALRVSKPVASSNFQVLNLDRNSGNSLTGKGQQGPETLPSKSKPAPTLKSEGRGGAVLATTFAERRPTITQQNRSEFFNSLRKKTYSSSAASEQSLPAQATTLEKPDGINFAGSKEDSPGDDSQSSPHFNGEEAEKGSSLDPEEEERLLRLFGWKENAGEEEEALTAEEIDAFMEEYQKQLPASKFSRLNLNIPAALGVGDSDEGSQVSQGEGF